MSQLQTPPAEPATIAAPVVEHRTPTPLRLAAARRSPLSADRLLRWVTAGSASVILVMLAALIVVLLLAAMPSIRQYGFGFLASRDWRPNEIERPLRGPDGKLVLDEDGERVTETLPPSFGALNVIYGTTVSSVLALVFAVPLSLGASIFLVRIASKRLVGPVSFLVEFLAAIPSIAYGIWGLFVLTPLLQGGVRVAPWLAWLGSVPGLRAVFPTVPDHATPNPDDTMVAFLGIEPILRDVLHLGSVPGLSWLFQDTVVVAGKEVLRPLSLTGRDMFAGGLILGIMIVPIITAISRDVLRGVPRAQVEGTTALGATWWQSSKEMLKYSRSGLFGAVMLGLARAAGETMAVTMVIGNKNQIAASPFAPAQTMSSLLANEFAEASNELHRSALIEVALVLLVMSLAFNVVARYLVVGGDARTAAAH